MTTDLELLANRNREKADRTIDLVIASLSDYQPFDPSANYTPKQLEPYDALADRFVRAVECCLRYFRSLELLEFAEQSDSTRSTLNRLEKMGLVSDATLWLQMRNVRNRIVHDYLPEHTAQMYAEISAVYGNELLRIRQTGDRPRFSVDPAQIS